LNATRPSFQEEVSIKNLKLNPLGISGASARQTFSPGGIILAGGTPYVVGDFSSRNCVQHGNNPLPGPLQIASLSMAYSMPGASRTWRLENISEFFVSKFIETNPPPALCKGYPASPQLQ